MSRLTLRLPESLHRQLTSQARDEGVSLNHFIVYLLTRVATVTDLESQRSKFEELRSRFPEDEAEEALLELLAARAAPSP